MDWHRAYKYNLREPVAVAVPSPLARGRVQLTAHSFSRVLKDGFDPAQARDRNGRWTLAEVAQAMREVAGPDTAYDPKQYQRNIDALMGHCNAASFVVQRMFGGEIVGGTIQGEPHIWNRLPGGREVDVTGTQYGGKDMQPVTPATRTLPPRKKVNPRFARFEARVLSRLGTRKSEGLLHLLKYDRSQPREPAGHGIESGRWVKVQQGAVSDSVGLRKAAPTPSATHTLEEIANQLDEGGPYEWEETADMSASRREQARKNFAAATDAMEREARFQMTQEQSGLDWYQGDIREAFATASKDIPQLKDPKQQALFMVIAGIMSPATFPDDTWLTASQAYAHFLKTGTIPIRNPANRQLWRGGVVSSIKREQLQTLNRMVKDMGVDKAVAWLTGEHSQLAIAYARKQYAKSPVRGFTLQSAGERAPGYTMFGPKVGQFIGSMHNVDGHLAVDQWALRTFNRYFKQVNNPLNGVSSGHEAPTARQRTAIKQMMAEVAKRVGVQANQVQSVLWFYEQQLYHHLGGKPYNARNLSFSDGAAKYHSLLRRRRKADDGFDFTHWTPECDRWVAAALRRHMGVRKQDYAHLLKFDPAKHPRVPAGHGDDSGEFTATTLVGDFGVIGGVGSQVVKLPPARLHGYGMNDVSETRVFQNPSERTLTEYGLEQVRFLIDDQGDVFVWNAKDAFHHQMKDALGRRNRDFESGGQWEDLSLGVLHEAVQQYVDRIEERHRHGSGQNYALPTKFMQGWKTLKWDESRHRRVPAGQGDHSGEFTSMDDSFSEQGPLQTRGHDTIQLAHRNDPIPRGTPVNKVFATYGRYQAWVAEQRNEYNIKTRFWIRNTDGAVLPLAHGTEHEEQANNERPYDDSERPYSSHPRDPLREKMEQEHLIRVSWSGVDFVEPLSESAKATLREYLDYMGEDYSNLTLHKLGERKYGRMDKFGRVHMDTEYATALKFDPAKHPRTPAGHGDESGQFTVQGDTGPLESLDDLGTVYHGSRDPWKVIQHGFATPPAVEMNTEVASWRGQRENAAFTDGGGVNWYHDTWRWWRKLPKEARDRFQKEIGEPIRSADDLGAHVSLMFTTTIQREADAYGAIETDAKGYHLGQQHKAFALDPKKIPGILGWFEPDVNDKGETVLVLRSRGNINLTRAIISDFKQYKRGGKREWGRILKFDPAKHPRVPAGQGDKSGEFTSTQQPTDSSEVPTGGWNRPQGYRFATYGEYQRWVLDTYQREGNGPQGVSRNAMTDRFWINADGSIVPIRPLGGEHENQARVEWEGRNYPTKGQPRAKEPANFIAAKLEHDHQVRVTWSDVEFVGALTSAQRATIQEYSMYRNKGGGELTLWKLVDGRWQPIDNRKVAADLAQADLDTAGRLNPEQRQRPPKRKGRFKGYLVTLLKACVDLGAHLAASSPRNSKPQPSKDQILAGTATLGHITYHGLNISIENPEGSTRTDLHHTPPQWSNTIKQAHYGYIKGTHGRDKEHIDTFVKPGVDEDHPAPVFVIDQVNASNTFDEHKVMLGYDTEAEAIQAYKANYPKDFKVGPVTPTTMDEFKQWLTDGDTTKPFRLQKSESQSTGPVTFASVLALESAKAPIEEPPFSARDVIQKWDEARHPRGQTSPGTNEGSFAPKGKTLQGYGEDHWAHNEPMPQKPYVAPTDEQRQNIKEALVYFTMQTHNEKGGWVDSKGQINWREGHTNGVPLHGILEEALNDATFYHTHPSGGPPSLSDLWCAEHFKMREMHAIDAFGGDYLIVPKPGVQMVDVAAQFDVLDRAIRRVIDPNVEIARSQVLALASEDIKDKITAEKDKPYSVDQLLFNAHMDLIWRTLDQIGLVNYAPTYGSNSKHMDKLRDWLQAQVEAKEQRAMMKIGGFY